MIFKMRKLILPVLSIIVFMLTNICMAENTIQIRNVTTTDSKQYFCEGQVNLGKGWQSMTVQKVPDPGKTYLIVDVTFNADRGSPVVDFEKDFYLLDGRGNRGGGVIYSKVFGSQEYCWDLSKAGVGFKKGDNEKFIFHVHKANLKGSTLRFFNEKYPLDQFILSK